VRAKVRNSLDKEAAVFGTARPQMSSLWSFVTSGYRVASVFESEAAQEVCGDELAVPHCVSNAYHNRCCKKMTTST